MMHNISSTCNHIYLSIYLFVGVQCIQGSLAHLSNVFHRGSIWQCARSVQGWQRGPVPPPAEGAPGACQAAAQVCRGQGRLVVIFINICCIIFVQPLFLVMHGGSGSSAAEIGEAVSNGVVKMNIDTDTQWAYWDGLKEFYKKNEGYLQGQVG